MNKPQIFKSIKEQVFSTSYNMLPLPNDMIFIFSYGRCEEITPKYYQVIVWFNASFG